ncbi:MAG: 16S rRNA (guanine(966)-N(2))-methyltransferase RsmD [Tissierellia bacterium]|nr:16S rRNA (guanine(966)-N(2))-methyltransferase RsmD [Tissierellia bacterium]
MIIYNNGGSMRIISGIRKGKKLKSPKNMDQRPTLDRVKESVFNIIKGEIQEKTVLDLFAGSGNIGIEFISRGAKMVYFIDNDQEAYNLINYNLKDARLEDFAKVIKLDSMKFLKSSNKSFDLIYIDPPYNKKYLYEKTLKIISMNKLLKANGKIILEKQNGVKIKNEDLFNIIDSRKYGDTIILFLEEKQSESDLSG